LGKPEVRGFASWVALGGAGWFVWAVGRKRPFNDHPFSYHQEIEIEIRTLTNLGSGLGRITLPEGAGPEAAPANASPPAEGESGPDVPSRGEGGWVVMVPFTLPGERVRARVYRNHRNFSEADLVAVLVPSPDRIAPGCPLFGRCGGCQYQHLAYPAQLAWKRRQVGELLQHLAGIEFPVAPVVPSPREFGYRSKITPHFAAPRAEKEAEAAKPFPIGFLRQGTRFDILDVPDCPIATEAINLRLAEVRQSVRARAAGYARGATLLLREASGVVTTDYDAVITETIDLAGPGGQNRSPPADRGRGEPDSDSGDLVPPGRVVSPGPGGPSSVEAGRDGETPSGTAPGALRLRFLARDFFQNNPFILPAFVGYVRDQAAGSGARFLVDAYCGSGLFALAAAPAFERVAGIEISESSIRFARENADANGIPNARFQAGDAAAIFAGLEFPPAETAVVIDPPRKGCDEGFLGQLFAFGPRAVVYVSCDPATQMRDLKGFLAAGYTLTAVQPFDLFPQTRHLECVLTLRRAG